MAASVQLNYKAGDTEIQPPTVVGDREESEQSSPVVAGEGVKLSRAEAKLAWLAAGGDAERAVKQLLRDRQIKVRKFTTVHHTLPTRGFVVKSASTPSTLLPLLLFLLPKCQSNVFKLLISISVGRRH